MGKNTKLALTLNLLFFIIILAVHLLRIFTGFYVKISDWVVPVWISIVGSIIILVLIYLNYKAL